MDVIALKFSIDLIPLLSSHLKFCAPDSTTRLQMCEHKLDISCSG